MEGCEIGHIVSEDDLYYSPKNSAGPLEIRVRWNRPQTVRFAVIREHLQLSQRIEQFELWAEKEGQVETVGFAFREGAVKTITLTAASPVALGADKAGATEFWFCLPPTAFKNGFAVSSSSNKY